MSMSEILIYRSLPIVNGYVMIPPVLPEDKIRVSTVDALSLVVGSEVANLSIGSGEYTGSKFGAQSFLRLPGVAADSWYSSNPIDPIS